MPHPTSLPPKTIPSKFAFDEKVRVTDATILVRSPTLSEGHVVGMSQADDGRWVYGVAGTDDLVHSVEESALESLGSFVDPSEDATGEIVRVAVDTRGRGRVVDRRQEGD